jgi:dihydroflavonol-4-reductase
VPSCGLRLRGSTRERLFPRSDALFDPTIRQVLPSLGKRNRSSNAKAVELLGWSPRPVAESVVNTARSLIDLGIVRP